MPLGASERTHFPPLWEGQIEFIPKLEMETFFLQEKHGMFRMVDPIKICNADKFS